MNSMWFVSCFCTAYYICLYWIS